jgi:putative DNA primase/helicase
MMLDPCAMAGASERINGDYASGLQSCIRMISLAQPDNRFAVFQNMAREAAGYVRKGGISVSELADRFQGAAVAYGLVEAYGQDAIQAVLADALKEHPALNGAGGPRADNGRMPTPSLDSRCAADIRPEKIDWVWPRRLARGKHTCIAGEPGAGKSQLSVAIIAAVTTKETWPCGEGRAPLGNVIILSAEDGASDTIVPRLLAAGADLNRVHVVSAVHGANGRRALNLRTTLIRSKTKSPTSGTSPW